MTPLDRTRLIEALALAEGSFGLTEPNPRVGCVLGRADGSVLGRGATQQAGGAHAEVMALRDAASAGHVVVGATAWVTLEPCAHHGRTPPCCDALIAAGLARVVVAVGDPFSQVAYNRGMPISPIPELVAELAAGRMVILVDEEDRENEGDLVLAAEHVTPEAINFMARFARGLICLTLTRERCEQLQLPPMASAQRHQARHRLHGVDRGRHRRHHRHLGRRPRAHRAGGGGARRHAADLVQPGHIFPLQAQDGGVLMRAGHTEAGCDLAAWPA
jgi:3,4-dihydroxy-2-butanone 4-phosphate synthase/pyrimidine deaminase RibD-like protein